MKTIYHTCCACVLVILSSGLLWAQEVEKPIPLTMCELFEHPEQYVGKTVKVRGASVGAELWVGNATMSGPVKNCSAWLNVIVVFPRQVSPTPGFDVVRDESLIKLENAINHYMRIDQPTKADSNSYTRYATVNVSIWPLVKRSGDGSENEFLRRTYCSP